MTLSTDPLTGNRWTLCGTRTTIAAERIDGTFARCGGCHRPVTVTPSGDWTYATEEAR